MTTSAERIQQLLKERDTLRKRLRYHHEAGGFAHFSGGCDICLDADSKEGDE